MTLRQGEEILKNPHTAFGGDGLRMKLDTVDREMFMA
jgi:hypothetical protein